MCSEAKTANVDSLCFSVRVLLSPRPDATTAAVDSDPTVQFGSTTTFIQFIFTVENQSEKHHHLWKKQREDVKSHL